MTGMYRFSTWVAAVVLGLIGSEANAQSPLSTAFTYQGQLTNNGVPLTGTADFEFSLWDDPLSPWDGEACSDPPTADPTRPCPRIGEPLRLDDVPVANGLFHVQLDFGVGAFSGADARWLQVAVRAPHDPNDFVPFTELTPRQPLTGGPYSPGALYADSGVLESNLGGLVSFTTGVKDCEVSEYGIDCEEISSTAVAVREGNEVHMEFLAVRKYSQNGEPVTEEVTYTASVNKRPRAGVPGDRAFDVNVEIVEGEETHNFTVAPDRPIYSSRDDDAYNGDIKVQAYLITDDLVLLVTDADTVKVIKTESVGAIIEAQVEPYMAGDRMARLKVKFGNYGDLGSDYVVTVTGTASHVAPVPTRTVTLEPYDEHEFHYTLRTSDFFQADEACLVTLTSTTGRIYDETTVTFPSPDEAEREIVGPPSGQGVGEPDASVAVDKKHAGERSPYTLEIEKLRAEKNAQIAALEKRLVALERLTGESALQGDSR